MNSRMNSKMHARLHARLHAVLSNTKLTGGIWTIRVTRHFERVCGGGVIGVVVGVGRGGFYISLCFNDAS
jgi:hypothetical protein